MFLQEFLLIWKATLRARKTVFRPISRYLEVDPLISFYISYRSLPHVFHFRCFEMRWDETLNYFSVFGYQMKHSFSCLIVWYVTAQCLDIRWNTPSRVWDILLLLFDALLLVVWISDETLLHLFNILRLGVWISDETFLLVFDVLLLGVCYQMKHPCRLWYIFSILL